MFKPGLPVWTIKINSTRNNWELSYFLERSSFHQRLHSNTFFDSLMETIIMTIRSILFAHLHVFQVDISKAQMICSLIESSLLEPGMLDRSHSSQNITSLLLQLFAWSYLWSVGGNLTDESQVRFSKFAREQFENNSYIRLVDIL